MTHRDGFTAIEWLAAIEKDAAGPDVTKLARKVLPRVTERDGHWFYREGEYTIVLPRRLTKPHGDVATAALSPKRVLLYLAHGASMLSVAYARTCDVKNCVNPSHQRASDFDIAGQRERRAANKRERGKAVDTGSAITAAALRLANSIRATGNPSEAIAAIRAAGELRDLGVDALSLLDAERFS